VYQRAGRPSGADEFGVALRRLGRHEDLIDDARLGHCFPYRLWAFHQELALPLAEGPLGQASRGHHSRRPHRREFGP
jgi:hypothetical protein